MARNGLKWGEVILIDCRSDNEGSKKQPFGGRSPPKGPMKFFRSQNTLCTIQEWVGGQSKLSSTSEMTAERRPLKITHLAQRGNEEQRIGALFPLSVPNEETPRGVSGTTDVH